MKLLCKLGIHKWSTPSRWVATNEGRLYDIADLSRCKHCFAVKTINYWTIDEPVKYEVKDKE